MAERGAEANRGHRASLLALALAIVLVGSSLTLIAPLPAQAAAPSVQVVHSLELVRPGDLPAAFPAATSSASLRAIRNEFESFQIVVHGGDTGVDDVAVAVDGALVGPGAAEIPAANVRPYVERYYTVTTPSDREIFPDGDVEPGLDGHVRCTAGALHCRFPDALVPERDVFYDEDRNAFPLDVPPGENRVVWVDVLVPHDAAVGDYLGSLSVTGAGVDQTVPLAVEVLDLGGAAMPSTPTLRGGVQISTGAFCTAHGGCEAIPGGNQGLYDRYLVASLENRFPFTRPMIALPDGNASWTSYGAPAVTGATSARLPGAAVTDVLFTRYDATYDATFADEWKQRQASVGGADLVAYYCDEMGASGSRWETECEPGYDTARGLWDAAVVAPDPGALSVVHTGDDATLAYGRGRPSHDAADNVDTLVLLANRLDNPVYGGDQRPDYDTGFLAESSDHQVWLYTTCESAGCSTSTTFVDAASTAFVGTPGALIDQPPSQVRSLGWHDFTYDVTGDFYYQAVGSLSTAWATCSYPPTDCQFVEGANGDGNLFYPGTPAAIGGTTHIPVESIRLKRIRDGREDYEILHWLSANGYDAEARAIATGLFPTISDSTADPADVAAARHALLDLLAPAPSPPGAPAAPAVTPGVESLTATWSPPADDGGSAITRYDLQVANSAGGEKVGLGDVTSPHLVDSLVAGEGRKVRVRARNAAGVGAWSPWSAVVVPSAAPTAPIELAYTEGAGDARDIWGRSIDGSSVQQLTGTGGAATGAGVADWLPDWSPDGTRLAFVRGVGAAADLWVMDADGGNQVQLTGTGLPAGGDGIYDAKPSWSPDGSRIAFVRGQGTAAEVWIMTSDGTDARQLTSNSIEDLDPTWSPEGARVLYGSRRTGPEADLVVVGADGRGEQVVSGSGPFTASGDEDLPDWWRGTTVATDWVDGGDYDIAVGEIGGAGSATNITAASTAHDFSPSWSPDGTRLAFLSTRAGDGDVGGDGDLFVMDDDGTGVVRLTADTAAQADVDWRPEVPGQTFVVDSTADGMDADPGDGTCATIGGACTLRAAVMEADATGAADTISLPAGSYGRTRTGASPVDDQAATGSLEVTAPLTIVGAGPAASVVDANGAEPVFEVVGQATLRLQGVGVTEGEDRGIDVVDDGRLVADDCAVTGTIDGPGAGAIDGTGIVVWSGAAATVRRCTIADSATSAVAVGAVGSLLVDRSTLSAATVGIDVQTVGEQPGTEVLVVTSTVSGNVAAVSGDGDVRIASSTIVDNAVVGGVTFGELTVESSIVDSLGTGDDCVPSAGDNLLAVAGSCPLKPGDQAGASSSPLDPALGPLADNGGPTLTHLPAATSPAVDMGDAGGCPGLLPGASTSDQRGSTRPVDGDGAGGARCDVGAVEREAPAPEAPGVPTVSTVDPALQGVDVGWSGPGDDGGSAVTGFDVELVAGGVPVVGSRVTVGDVSSVRVPAAGCVPVGVRARARNAVGPGSWSGPSAVVLPWERDGFVDVGVGADFYDDIVWMATSCLSTGWPDGTYRPGLSMSRQAMAAFLWRLAGSPSSGLGSPFFADVGPGHQFYEAIQWMGASGVSTGTPQPGGLPRFEPDADVSRQAMAAFLHRFDGDVAPPVVEHVFADVTPGAFFYDDIQWMGIEGISTGTPQPPGKPLYAPNEPVSRQAMAAFIHRMQTR